MKFLIILAVAAVVFAEEFYDAKYDNFDVEELIANERLLSSFAACFLNSGKCTAEAADFKKWIPEGVQTSCGKCSEKQKYLVGKTIRAMKEKLPPQYKDLNTMYNPDGKFTAALDDFISKY